MEKMSIFLSWHGHRGKAVAAALEDWLPQIVNAFSPWFSHNIDKGSRWRTEVASGIASAKAGIIILTPSALTAPWVLFEAGAIAKDPGKTYACTLLVDVKIEDVRDPLSQFTPTPANDREEMLKLVMTLNNTLQAEKEPDDRVKKSFYKWWPDLEKQLKSLPADEPTKPPSHRDQQDILAEILTLTRQTIISVSEAHGDILTNFNTLFKDLGARPILAGGAGGVVNLSALESALAGRDVFLDDEVLKRLARLGRTEEAKKRGESPAPDGE